jgi:Leucine-rich repeat (LRR) protein
MTTHLSDLYMQLMEAYSDASLNRITAGLLTLYRSKQYEQLRQLARKVSALVQVDDTKMNKCFSQLIMLYHPDKGAARRRDIESLSAAGNEGGLHRYSHIFFMNDIEYLPPLTDMSPQPGFEAEYVWETGTEGLGARQETDDESFDDEQFTAVEEEFNHTFFQAVKLRAYGTLTVELPFYYLEDFEEIEMAESGIHSLEGIEYCLHAKVIDISGNAITDITDLQSLIRTTELYASGNRIGYIDALSNLVNLRTVDLSLNEIDDISPLFGLEHLEYVNLLGNPVPPGQITVLKDSGCTVLF